MKTLILFCTCALIETIDPSQEELMREFLDKSLWLIILLLVTDVAAWVKLMLSD